MKWVIWLLLAILLLFCTAAAALFRYAFLHRGRGNEIDEVRYEPMKPFRDEVLGGIRWFQAQHPEQVFLTSDDGLKLCGYYLPHPAPRGAVLLVHGYQSSWALDFGAILKFYYDRVFSVLTFWQRAHGESEGRYICFGEKERFDCRRWTEYLCGRNPGLPVFLDGVSMGASTVMMTAGFELPDNVRGLIADCGFTSPWDQFAGILRAAHVPVHPLLDAVDLLTKALAGFGLRDCSTEQTLAQSRIPILLVHGEADTFVPPAFSRRNFAAAAGEKKLVLIPGAGHAMSWFTDRARCESGLSEFLDRHAPRPETVPADDAETERQKR